MSDVVHLATIDRPDWDAQVVLTLERSAAGARYINCRLHRADPSGVYHPTKFGISVRPREILAFIAALRSAEGMLRAEQLHPPAESGTLTNQQRMDRYLADAKAIQRNS